MNTIKIQLSGVYGARQTCKSEIHRLYSKFIAGHGRSPRSYWDYLNRHNNSYTKPRGSKQ